MLLNAKQILVSELVLAEHSSKDYIEDLVENKISTSFAEFNPETVQKQTGNIVKKFIPFNGTGTEA